MPSNTQDLVQMLAAYGPLVMMGVVFYLLLYRPQRKQMKKRQEMLRNLKKGDRIITTGGMFGTIIALTPQTVTIKAAEKVELEFLRTAVQGPQTEEK